MGTNLNRVSYNRQLYFYCYTILCTLNEFDLKQVYCESLYKGENEPQMELLIKKLTRNDANSISNQAGIFISREEKIRKFFPMLDEDVKNPRTTILFFDDDGNEWPFNYIHYNNKIINDGTRDEYRLTGMTAFFRSFGLRAGDNLFFWRDDENEYRISSIAPIAVAENLLELSGWQCVSYDLGDFYLEDSLGLDLPIEEEKYAEDVVTWDLNEKELRSTDAVRVVRKDFSVYELFRKYSRTPRRLFLDVDFQRNLVWTNRQKCELIESIMLGLPLPVFYFKQEEDATFSVIDGKQRLSTLFLFRSNEFKLKNLKILRFLNGKRFNDLTGELAIYQTQLEDYQVYCHVILPPTPDRYIFEIFGRVNKAGTKLNNQEIRNAIYHGKGMNLIKEIAKSEEFNMVTGINYASDKRMKSSYMLTRFIAFYLERNNQLMREENGKLIPYKYDGHMDEFLGKALRRFNALSDTELEKHKEIIIRTLVVAREILGSGAFRRYLIGKNPLNLNLFEVEMCYFSGLILEKKEIDYIQIKQAITNAILNERFNEALNRSRDNIKDVQERFNLFYEAAEIMG